MLKYVVYTLQLVFLFFGLFHLRSAAHAQNGQLLCSTQAAYLRGMIDAQHGRRFKKNYGDTCPEIMQKNLQQFYLQGFQAGGGKLDEKDRREQRPNSEQKCIFTPTGRQICGYDCVKSISRAKCATRPDHHCVVGRFDDVACGFHCIPGNDRIYCAQRKSDSCIRDNFGNVKCGKNCRINNFNLQCDVERYAKSQ